MRWKLPVGWSGKFGKYKYLLLMVFVGMLLLVPKGTSGQERERSAVQTQLQGIDLTEMERRLEAILSRISGAGKVSVVLTLKDGGRQVFAQDVRRDQQEQAYTTVVVGQGGGGEQPILVQQFSPAFQGALAVCPGGGDPGVRLQLTQAICALTGLSSEKITICQGE